MISTNHSACLAPAAAESQLCFLPWSRGRRWVVLLGCAPGDMPSWSHLNSANTDQPQGLTPELCFRGAKVVELSSHKIFQDLNQPNIRQDLLYSGSSLVLRARRCSRQGDQRRKMNSIWTQSSCPPGVIIKPRASPQSYCWASQHS